MRRIFFAFIAAMVLAAGRADAVTIRDIIELSKAGLSEPVLLALIEVDRSVFTIDTATLKKLKDGGVSDAVIVALIRSGRTPPPQRVEPAVATTDPDPEPAKEPQVIVIDHHDAPPAAPQPVAVPVAYPVYVPVVTPSRQFFRNQTVTTVLPTDQGLVRARVPVPAGCIKAQPVFWGFDGKLRPGSWEPPPTVVCR
jgi:hypothetical protein